MLMRIRLPLSLALAALFAACVLMLFRAEDAPAAEEKNEPHRSPVDVVILAGGEFLASANQTSNSVSLIRLSDGELVQEISVGERPTYVEAASDGRTLLVSCDTAGDIEILKLAGDKLTRDDKIHVGFRPHGVAISGDGKTAYAALTASNEIAVLDLAKRKIAARIPVSRWPRYVALSADGKRLAIGASGDQGVAVVDTESRKQLFLDEFTGLNIGHLKASKEGHYAYFPWVIYRRQPPSVGNIRLGWVLGSRIGRLRLDKESRREAFTLDARGRAIADPHGIDLTSDEQTMVVSASGTHELLVYRVPGLPFQDYGSTDHIDRRLLGDPDRFHRIELGGRPMGLQIAGDGRTVYIANYLRDSVQVVNLDERKVVLEIPLGGPSQPSLARKGESIFYDAKYSLDQWYSCHSCHYEGGGNAVGMDTLNDDTVSTYKTVLPLFNLSKTGPWTWHGWQTDLRAAMNKSITSTMQGRKPSEEDVEAMIAFFSQFKAPPNPYSSDGRISEAAQRGKRVFESDRAGCATCHKGPLFTDGLIHDLGLGGSRDKYKGFNTPTLIGVYNKVRLLHDGRRKTLEAVLTGPHNPKDVSGGELTKEELSDLIEYLKTL